MTETSKILRIVYDRLKLRESKGLIKYGCTLDREDLSFLDYLIHIEEELLDAVMYITKIKEQFNHMLHMGDMKVCHKCRQLYKKYSPQADNRQCLTCFSILQDEKSTEYQDRDFTSL